MDRGHDRMKDQVTMGLVFWYLWVEIVQRLVGLRQLELVIPSWTPVAVEH